MHDPSRYLLRWERTVILSVIPDDYMGYCPDDPNTFARVHHQVYAPQAPWQWVLNVQDRSYARGFEATLQDAVDAAERSFATWLAGP